MAENVYNVIELIGTSLGEGGEGGGRKGNKDAARSSCGGNRSAGRAAQ